MLFTILLIASKTMILLDFAKHTVKFFRDRIEHVKDNTNKLTSRNGNIFDSAISNTDPVKTRILLYEKGKPRSIGSADIIYPRHQFMKPREQRDMPVVSFQFKNFEKHSKYAHEAGQLCLSHVFREGYKGVKLNLETDYSKLTERMGIKDYRFSVDDSQKKPFSYEIPLYNSLNNQHPDLANKVNSFLQETPEAVKKLHAFLDRSFSSKQENQTKDVKQSNALKLNSSQEDESQKLKVIKLKVALANEIAKSPLFAERILNEVKQAEKKQQETLLQQAKEIIKNPSHRISVKEQAQEKIESQKQKAEVKQEQQEQKQTPKQDKYVQNNGVWQSL